MTSDDDRIAYLAGDGHEHDLDEDERVELDELRALLGDPALWEEPSPALEDAVVAALARPSAHRRRPTRLAVALGAVAAVALAAVGVAALLTSGGDDAAQFEAALSATELAPQAQGDAAFTRTGSGWRIELEVTGLPRRDDGAFYQAWLRDDAGELVAIGTFNEGPEVILWSGVSPAEHPTMTITEETVDGNPGSSGRRVLVGSAAPS